MTAICSRALFWNLLRETSTKLTQWLSILRKSMQLSNKKEMRMFLKTQIITSIGNRDLKISRRGLWRVTSSKVPAPFNKASATLIASSLRLISSNYCWNMEMKTFWMISPPQTKRKGKIQILMIDKTQAKKMKALWLSRHASKRSMDSQNSKILQMSPLTEWNPSLHAMKSWLAAPPQLTCLPPALMTS